MDILGNYLSILKRYHIFPTIMKCNIITVWPIKTDIQYVECIIVKTGFLTPFPSVFLYNFDEFSNS